MIQPFAWYRYSRKLKRRIEKPINAGTFEKDDRGFYLAIGEGGSLGEDNFVRLHCLVDTEDGTIIDAKFQVRGQSALIGAADGACDLIVGKNYDQARRVNTGLIDQMLRDRDGKEAFPWEAGAHLNMVLEAIEAVAETCTDIPLPKAYAAPPTSFDPSKIVEGGYPGWLELDTSQKRGVIEGVLDRDIRPFIAMDAGGVEIVSLEGDTLKIAYQGTCTSCFSAVGATLSFIQQTLQNQVWPDLTVVPEI